MARLGDLVTIVSSSKRIDGEKFWLLNLDMIEQQTGRIVNYLFVDESKLDGSIIQFDADTVLYSKLRPNLNKVVLPSMDGYATSELLPLKPDSSKLYKNYLAIYLRSEAFVTWAVSKTAGAKMPRLGTKELLNKNIPLPSLDEQRRISAYFEQIDELIFLRKQQLSKLDELVKARFVELFGDGHDGKTPLKMLGSICKFQQGTQIPVDEQFEEQKDGYKRFLRIIDYTQAPQPPRYVNVNGKEVNEKSVVVVRYGATAGFIGRGYQGILANNLFEIIPDETILRKEFLFLALKYGTFEKEVHDKAFGAAMPALSFSMMNGIPVVVPMSEQQSQFVSFVEQVDKSKFEIQKSLEKLETLKKALMQKYFG